MVFSSCTTPPKPDLCGIINRFEAECNPTDPEKPSYDKLVREMIGYTCLSPKDTSDLKKYIRKLLEELDSTNYSSY